MWCSTFIRERNTLSRQSSKVHQRINDSPHSINTRRRVLSEASKGIQSSSLTGVPYIAQIQSLIQECKRAASYPRVIWPAAMFRLYCFPKRECTLGIRLGDRTGQGVQAEISLALFPALFTKRAERLGERERKKKCMQGYIRDVKITLPENAKAKCPALVSTRYTVQTYMAQFYPCFLSVLVLLRSPQCKICHLYKNGLVTSSILS